MSDDAVRARDGKIAVVTNTLWELRVGNFCVRCVREDSLLVVQAKYHSTASYHRIATGTDSKALLDKILASKGLDAVLAEQQKLVLSR